MKLTNEQYYNWKAQLERAIAHFHQPKRTPTLNNAATFLIICDLIHCGTNSLAESMACVQDRNLIAAFGTLVQTVLNETPVVTPAMSDVVDGRIVIPGKMSPEWLEWHRSRGIQVVEPPQGSS